MKPMTRAEETVMIMDEIVNREHLFMDIVTTKMIKDIYLCTEPNGYFRSPLGLKHERLTTNQTVGHLIRAMINEGFISRYHRRGLYLLNESALFFFTNRMVSGKKGFVKGHSYLSAGDAPQHTYKAWKKKQKKAQLSLFKDSVTMSYARGLTKHDVKLLSRTPKPLKITIPVVIEE